MSKFVKDMTIFNKDIDYVNGLIPEDSRMNFERNLCFLKVDLIDEKDSSIAYYSPDKNMITLCRKPIKMIKKNNNDFSTFFNYIARHELIHVASCFFDKKNNIIYSGFSKRYLNKEDEDKTESNNILEEGFVDLLLRKDYPNTSHTYSIYVPLVDMLSEIVGMDFMKETFFNSRGIEPIISKLMSYGIKEENVKEYFYSFNNIEKDIREDKITTALPNLQSMLIDFYSKKIETINSKEDIIESKNSFIDKYNSSVETGTKLCKDLYTDTTYYNYRTNDLKKKVKSI